MRVYLDLVIILNILVDFMLLLGTNRLTGFSPGGGRCAAAAAFGGVYAGACLLPGMFFLGNLLWRTVSLCLMAVIAFGINRSTIRRGAIFVLLCMAMGGIALTVGKMGFLTLAFCGTATLLLCRFGVRRTIGAGNCIPVELEWRGKKMTMLALRDTGNTLCDPITGEEVLVAGSDVAEKLIGFTPQELCDPVQTVASGKYYGLRLVPYRAVGQPGGMLVAMRFHNARIGKEYKDPLVAFAPQVLGRGAEYQMLTGGAV